MRVRYLKPVLSLALALLVGHSGALSQTNAPHGLDLAGMDKSVNPGDDFFRYANGHWLKTTEIPPDRSSIGVFNMLAAEANRRLADLIQEIAKSNTRDTEARKIADFYSAYMDEQAI